MSLLSRLLRPKSIAVIGGGQAHEVIRQCQKMGYNGDIWPVHPHKSTIEGYPAFKQVEDLPSPPDAAFIGVNRHATIQIVSSLANMGAGGAVCYASGFLEADETGQALQAELLKQAGDMPVLGPNCYGFINYADGVLLWPDQHGGDCLEAGEKGVAIVTQSSNISINLTMQQRGLPIAYMLTAGNQAQVGLSALALATLEDERVTALGLHIEGFDSVVQFEQLALRARELNKPIVVLKVGKSDQAVQAAMTHTASLAGSDAAASAFLSRLGIARVSAIPSFLEALKVLHVHGVLTGFKLASMSCSGGEASIMADAVSGRRVYYPAISDTGKASIQAVLGDLVTVSNPLDYHTYIWSDEQGMQQVFAGMLALGFDMTSLVVDFPRQQRCDDADWQRAMRAFVSAVNNSPHKAALVASLNENLPKAYIKQLMQQGIVAIGGIEEAINAFEAAAIIGELWQKMPSESLMSFNNNGVSAHNTSVAQAKHFVSQSDAKRYIHKAKSTVSISVHTITLDEASAKAALNGYGVNVAKGEVIRSVEEATQASKRMGYPLVMKRLGIAHKTESNAVCLGINDDQTLIEQAQRLLSLTGDDDQQQPCVYIEAMIQQAVGELIIGITRDAQFGLVMTLGAGGIFVEILRDTQTLLLPSSREAIADALANLRIAPLFNGYRGKAKGDMEAALDNIMAIQHYALAERDKLVELDVNPLIICATGHSAYAADALIVLADCKEKTNG